MPLVLQQEKIDVAYKQRSNCFNWKGQFTPEFVEYLLDCYAVEKNVVADPFSGSGTVLSESIKKNMSCIGFEINPSAYFMSKFYEYAKYSQSERHKFYKKIKASVGLYIESLPSDVMVYVDSSDYRVSYKNLITFARYVSKNMDGDAIPFMINVIFLCEKDKKLSLRDSLVRNIIYIRNLLFNLPCTQNNVVANLDDARNLGLKYKNLVDLVITSPPYINVFNYHQNYRGIVECFDYDILKVASSEFGSNRKHRSNRFKTVVQYTMDMGHALFNTSIAVKKGGKMIFVVGRESMVRKTPFYNSRIIQDIVNVIPSLRIENISERKFENRYGECIKEDVIVIDKYKKDVDVDFRMFEQIGMNHIKNALSYAGNDLKNDLLAILEKKDLIIESPIY